MQETFKRQNAITLIALVITIIVLLILAGVSIAMLTGENGILNQAQEAKEQTEFKSAEEKVKLAIMGARATDGKITTATSIRPYQTYWYKDNSFMKTAFKTATNGTKYYDLIIPQGSNTTYWLASRCVNAGSSYCYFNMRFVNGGRVNAGGMYDSNDGAGSHSLALFPAVSLNSELISGNKTNGFTVQ